jgi:hypothetical protein
MIAEDAIKRFALRSAGFLGFRENAHSRGHPGRARSHQSSIDLYHAGIARLDRSKLRVIADLRNLYARSIDHIDQAFAARCLLNYPIDGYA